MTPKTRVGIVAFTSSFGLDRLTKELVNANLSYSDSIPVIEGFFYLTHVRNTGAAFGLFADAPAALRLTFFVGVATVAIGIIFSFFRKLAPGERLSALALGMILGGACGNLYDRIWYGEVVDFLRFRLWGGYTWPDFNIADSAVVVGVGILMLELIASEGENRARAEERPAEP